MSRFLFGIHDPGGEHLMADAPGWIVHTVALKDEGATDYRAWSSQGFSNIVRLNWGYGSDGTIPLPDKYADFARLCGLYVKASPGCSRWIIGNEPNHAQERPQGQPITSQMYAECFRLCRDAIRAVQPEAEVITAAIAPWNVTSGDWLAYFAEMLDAIGPGGLDGIALHAYTHGYDPALIASTAKMDGPYSDRHWHFRTYQDFLRRVPASMRRLPVYVTEFNQGDEAWVDANSGFVQRAYAEVDAWNKMGATQKIRCLCLYRWPNYDRWGLQDKAGVQADFRAAVARRYESPVVKVADKQPAHSVFVPIAPKEEGTVPQVRRQWDERLTQRGVCVEDAPPGAAWRVVKGEWLNEEEVKRVGPDHHILVDALDENGNRVVGVSFIVQWPSGADRITTKANPGQPYAADYPMSKSLNEFSITAVDGLASDRVTGIGMGAYGNPAIHTSTVLVFQRTAEQPATKPTPQPTAAPKNLAHPIADPALRIVSQHFGENPQAYAPLGVRGHTGIDYAVPMGTPVCAVDDGTVLEAQEDATGWGKYVKLGHTWGQSIYAHLDRMAVAVGHHVLRGQVIGQSGNTGRSTGPHLHFGIRLLPIRRGAADPTGMDGWTDPAPYLVEGRDPVEITPGGVWPIVREAAHEFGIDADLLVSLVMAESSGRPDAVSPRGAKGLGQIMPATWEEWRVKVQATDIFDPRDNARVSAAYLAWLLRVLGGDVRRALWAYVWGIGYVLSGGEPPQEAKDYATRILFGRDLLRAVTKED